MKKVQLITLVSVQLVNIVMLVYTKVLLVHGVLTKVQQVPKILTIAIHAQQVSTAPTTDQDLVYHVLMGRTVQRNRDIQESVKLVIFVRELQIKFCAMQDFIEEL